MTKRKLYTEEFIREAVQLAKQRGSLTEVAKDLGISSKLSVVLDLFSRRVVG